MKRFLSVCLTVCVLLSALSVAALAAASAEPAADPYAENLIVHYDFEGEDLDEQLADKATAGSSKENIKVPTGIDVLDVSVTDGVISYTGSKGLISMFYSAPQDEDPANAVDPKTQSGGDIRYNTTGEFTFYIDMAVKTDGLAKGGNRDCIRLTDTGSKHIFRTYFKNDNAGKKELYLQGKHDGFNPVQQLGDGNETAVARMVADGETFYQYAITMKYDKETALWTVAFYLSTNGGKTFSSTILRPLEANYAENIMECVKYLSLGNRNVSEFELDGEKHTIGTEYLFDDFRVYNKALTKDELVGIKHPELLESGENNGDGAGNTDSGNTDTENADTAPVTEPATEATTAAPDDSAAGCASSVSVSVSAVAALAVGSLSLLKKKKD